jgi:hypothetical protein
VLEEHVRPTFYGIYIDILVETQEATELLFTVLQGKLDVTPVVCKLLQKTVLIISIRHVTFGQGKVEVLFARGPNSRNGAFEHQFFGLAFFRYNDAVFTELFDHAKDMFAVPEMDDDRHFSASQLSQKTILQFYDGHAGLLKLKGTAHANKLSAVHTISRIFEMSSFCEEI